MNKKKWDTSRTICKFFTEHRVLRCFPMTFYFTFYSVIEKHVLCFSCSVNPSRLKHQIVGSRYRRCCIWCTRNATLYPSMALGKALRISSLSFPPIHPIGYMGIIRINIFPESFWWRVLALLRGVAFPGFGASGDTLPPRFFTEKTRTKNQNVRSAWCSDFKTRAKWT